MVQRRPRKRQARFFPACRQQRSKRLDRPFRLGKREHRFIADPLDRRSMVGKRLADLAFENLEYVDGRRVSVDIRDGAKSRQIDECNRCAVGTLSSGSCRCSSRRCNACRAVSPIVAGEAPGRGDSRDADAPSPRPDGERVRVSGLVRRDRTYQAAFATLKDVPNGINYCKSGRHLGALALTLRGITDRPPAVLWPRASRRPLQVPRQTPGLCCQPFSRRLSSSSKSLDRECCPKIRAL